MAYPLQSSQRSLSSSATRNAIKLRRTLGVRRNEQLRKLMLSNRSSLRENSSNGKLKPARQRFHNQIIQRQFRNRNSIDRKDPDLYVFGGLPASGKGTVLRKKVPEKTVVIDNDYYKEKLSRRTKSPIKGYKLAHAQVLHEEARVLVNRAIDKSIKQRRDVTYDGTMRNPQKARRIIAKYKKAGYDVHYLATQKKPAKAMSHATNRFLITGRFVPLKFIKNEGNQISKNSWNARKLADTHQIYDTNTMRSKLISKSKRSMGFNFRNPKN